MNTTINIDQELSQFEQMCAGFDPTRPDAREEVVGRWRDGVALWHALRPTGVVPTEFGREFARLKSAMTRIATTWLAPRYAGEPRDTIYARIPSLRPVAENERLQELMEKNNEGVISPEEHGELVHLNDFFDTLQPVLCDALLALPPRSRCRS